MGTFSKIFGSGDKKLQKEAEECIIALSKALQSASAKMRVAAECWVEGKDDTLDELEEEIIKLERDADKKLLTPDARRSAVSWAIQVKSYSQARACSLVGLHARTFRRKPRRSYDGVLRTRLKALAAERRRFGYRRLHILLRREGFEVNHMA